MIETGAKSEFHVYIVYEINLWPFTIGQDVTLGNCLVGGVKLTTNADPDQHKYSAIVLDLMRVEAFRCLMVVGLVKTL